MNKQNSVGKFDQNASLKKGIVVCLLAAALLVSMVGMASAVTQTWSLHDVDYAEIPAEDGQTPHALDKLMHKESPCLGSYVEATIKSGTPAWWYDYKAEVDSTFGENMWQAKIYHPTSGVAGKVINGEIWLVLDDGTTVKKLASGSGTIVDGAPSRSFDMPDNGATTQEFSVDQRLALKIWTPDVAGFKIRYDGASACSEIESPWTDPGFPVPELPTIILMSAGLLALAGFVVYSRSSRRTTKK